MKTVVVLLETKMKSKAMKYLPQLTCKQRECILIVLEADFSSFRPPRVQRYLVRVYGNLAMTTGSAALATILSIQGIIGEIGMIGVLGSLALVFGMQALRGRVSDQLRLGMLLAFGFLQGWSIGPLTGLVFDLDPDLLLMAVVGTLLAFVSFTGAALFSQRRSYLYLGAMLNFATLIILITSFFPFLLNFNLYLGLFLFCFYIIYDTQVIIERADMMQADRGGIDGALQLFTNLIGIFVRLLMLLSQNERKKKNKESRKE
jgi:Bax inhibitor 1